VRVRFSHVFRPQVFLSVHGWQCTCPILSGYTHGHVYGIVLSELGENSWHGNWTIRRQHTNLQSVKAAHRKV